MAKQKKARTIKQSTILIRWYMIQRIAKFADDLDRLPDAAAIRKDKASAAPTEMLPMIF